MAAEKRKFKSKFVWVVFVAIFAAGVVTVFLFGGKEGGSDVGVGTSEFFTVRRENLEITVTESGEVKALDSVDIKSKVEGKTTIITIVDEGTYISQEDVNNGKVLVELDSSEIERRLAEREISFLKAEASLAEAREALEIQKNQNESDIKGGEQKLRFALLDFRKYVGEQIASELVEKLAADANSEFEMEEYLEDSRLSAEALGKLKDLSDEITLSESRYERAVDKLDWTKKLFEKQYVAETELKADELEVQSLRIQKEKAEIALELFRQYEFIKEAEKRFSDHQEALRELERIKAKARAKLAQAEAKLASGKASYVVQKKNLEKMQKQFKACTICAPATGQVVYASSMGGRWQRRNRPIGLGETVRQRQKIICIPDPSVMKVEIKVHEMWIDKVEAGQKAEITVAAFGDKTFEGVVLKKAPMADPEEWMNPDLKVYTTDVRIEGRHDFLKTGMTAKVKILMDELEEVLIVPIQTVINQEGKKVCFVAGENGPERREVETGQFNNDFVEIKNGLSEGQMVLLNPPRLFGEESDVE